MLDLFGFDSELAQKERDEIAPKSLVAGKYKMMVTQVEIGNHPFGGDFTPVRQGDPISDDNEVRVSCVLTADANGFKEGWKHTLFFSPHRKDETGRLSSRALFDRGFLVDLSQACCGTMPKSEQEMVNKQFYITFKESNAKNGKTYLNITKIESLAEGELSAQTETTVTAPATEPNTAEPNWSTQEATASSDIWK